ncbi:MAG: transcription termination factor Rho [Acidimicrobiales bacterium]
MSVEASALERSKLEQKDRAELSAIVTAMGGKAGSRAKKADLVDQVLRLAGVVPSDRGPAATDNGAAARRNRGRGNGASTAATVETVTEPETETETDAKTEAAASPAPDAASPAQATVVPETVPTPASVDDPQLDGQSSGSVATDTVRADRRPPQGGEGRDRDNRDRDNRGQGQGQSGQGQQTQPGQQAQQQQASDGDPGNRRRRRRGRRDRDRPDRDQQPQSDEVFSGEPVDVEGHLDLRDDGYGFLRIKGFLPSKEDVYVSVKQVRQFGLRKGDHIKGASRPASRNEKNPALLRIDVVNGMDPEAARNRPKFEDLTPLFPDEKLRMERDGESHNMTTRIVDLISPIGKGQRGLIVSPPKAGKTTIMKEIARSIEVNNPDVHLIVLLTDERPEEVTDIRRWLIRGEVVASTFDRPSEEHTQVAELTIERAKRMVEMGRDVVIILDGITRLSRAYNLAAPATGRIMSGGVDSGALYPPKRFFGAARNIEEGGSLTILATALVETGSKMDEVIFEEFKGTGNLELRLRREFADKRIFPAIDVDASGTRREELLMSKDELAIVWKLRRVLSALDGQQALELLLEKLKQTKSNVEFLMQVQKTTPMPGNGRRSDNDD